MIFFLFLSRFVSCEVASVSFVERNNIWNDKRSKKWHDEFFSHRHYTHTVFQPLFGCDRALTVTNFLAIGSASCINVRFCLEYHRNRIPTRTRLHTHILRNWNWKTRDQRNLSASHILLSATILTISMYDHWLQFAVMFEACVLETFFGSISSFAVAIPHPRGHHWATEHYITQKACTQCSSGDYITHGSFFMCIFKIPQSKKNYLWTENMWRQQWLCVGNNAYTCSTYVIMNNEYWT